MSQEGDSADSSGAGEGMEQDGSKGTEAPEKNNFQIEVSNMPKQFEIIDFREFLAGTFKVAVPKVQFIKEENKVEVDFKDQESMEIVLRLINDSIWKGKRLHAKQSLPLESKKRKREEDEEGEEAKKQEVEVTAEEELLALYLPFLKVPYKGQAVITYRDAVLLSEYLHVQMCETNPELAGWAEKTCDENGGTLLKIDDPVTFENELTGYPTKCIFDTGHNAEGEAVVGLNLPEVEGRPARTIAVEPGDKLIHLPESVKLAVKTFQEFLRDVAKSPLGKKLMSLSFWQKLRISITSDGNIMMTVGLYAKDIPCAVEAEAKKQLKEYFMEGPGSHCNVVCLYVHVGRKRKLSHYKRMGYHLDDDMMLLGGQPFIEDTIGGLIYQISPFTPLKFNPRIMEKVLEGIQELADPPSDSVVISLCGWPSGIPFALVKKCAYTYCLESQALLVEDMEKTKVRNKINNMDLIHGSFEEELEKLFKKTASKSIIILLGLPRSTIITGKVVQLIRAQPNILRIVGICAEHKSGVKCWTELLSAPHGRDIWSGFMHEGNPFVPVRARSLNTAPFTHENTVLVLSERVDPSAYPAPTKPIPTIFPLSVGKPREKSLKRPPLKKAMSLLIAVKRPNPPAGGQGLRRYGPPKDPYRPPMAPYQPPMGRGPPMGRFGPQFERPGTRRGRSGPPMGRPVPPSFQEDPMEMKPYAEEEERTRQYYERRIAELERLKMVKASYALRVAELEAEAGVAGDSGGFGGIGGARPSMSNFAEPPSFLSDYERRIAELERLKMVKASYAMRVAELEAEAGVAGDSGGFGGIGGARPSMSNFAEPPSFLSDYERTTPVSYPLMGRGRGEGRNSDSFGQSMRLTRNGNFESTAAPILPKRSRGGSSTMGGFAGDFRYGDSFGGYRGGYNDGQEEMDYRSFEGASAYGGGRNGGEPWHTDGRSRVGRGSFGILRGMGGGNRGSARGRW